MNVTPAVIRTVLERKEIVEGLLQQTNLWDSRKKALGGYSGGMKQRFGSRKPSWQIQN